MGGRAHPRPRRAADFRAQKRAEAQAEYARQVASARAEAERQIYDQLEVLQGEAALARDEVGRMARSIANDMASRTLGRPLNPMGA